MSMYVGNQKVKPYVVGDTGIKYIWDENFDFSQPIDVTGYKKFSVNGGLIDDGHSRIWVDMSDESDLAITVQFNTSSNSQVIDWGDGNIETYSDTTNSQTRSHTYAQTGKYIIDISVNNNTNWNALGYYIVNQASDTTMRNKVIYVEDNTMVSFSCSTVDRFEYLTSLKKVKFGSNFQFANNKIPNYTCDGCIALESFDFHGATSIGAYAFRNCSSLALTSLPSGLINLGNGAFHNCISFTITSIPETITTYGNSIFYGCTGLTTITLPESMTAITYGFFNNCTNLTTVNFPSNLTSIGAYAFNECSNLVLTSLPNTITIIDSRGFWKCTKITLTTLPSALTTIGQQAFYDCDGLTQITIPAGITTINDSAFTGCSNLTSVTILATTPPTLSAGGKSVFPYSNTNFKIYVPSASLNTYKSATNWSELANYMEAIPS